MGELPGKGSRYEETNPSIAFNPLLVKEQVKIEEWTYNLGSTRFVRYLRVENGSFGCDLDEL